MPQKPYLNSYIAGAMLGMVLLGSYVSLGAGLGASAGIARIGAYCEVLIFPQHVEQSAYFGKWGNSPLSYYLVFMFVGVFLGGLLSSLWTGRFRFQLERGAKASRKLRFILVLVGGVLIGYASRLANGCTSGQALSGTALLLSGSIAFLVCLFAGGYVTAWFVRRQWND